MVGKPLSLAMRSLHPKDSSKAATSRALAISAFCFLMPVSRSCTSSSLMDFPTGQQWYGLRGIEHRFDLCQSKAASGGDSPDTMVASIYDNKERAHPPPEKRVIKTHCM